MKNLNPAFSALLYPVLKTAYCKKTDNAQNRTFPIQKLAISFSDKHAFRLLKQERNPCEIHDRYFWDDKNRRFATSGSSEKGVAYGSTNCGAVCAMFTAFIAIVNLLDRK